MSTFSFSCFHQILFNLVALIHGNMTKVINKKIEPIILQNLDHLEAMVTNSKKIRKQN